MRPLAWGRGGRQMERKEDMKKHGKFERMSYSRVERAQAYGGGGGHAIILIDDSNLYRNVLYVFYT